MTSSILLEAQAWEQAAKPKAIPPQLGNLVSENTEILTKILKISQKELEVLAQTYKDPAVLQQVLQGMINRGFIITGQHTEALATFQNNIGTAFQIGMSQGGGTPSPVMSIIQQTMTDSVMNYVTRMDAQLKKELGQILADGYRDKIGYKDITRQMSERIGIKESRAGMIARTETMRSSNMANWTQAKTSGAQYFTVDHRGAACQYCIKYFDGEIFGIDETRYVPPIHPNCACVAVYFQDKQDALEYSQRVHKRNVMERDLLTKQGHAIPKDGTGVNPTGKQQKKIVDQVNKTLQKTHGTKPRTTKKTEPKHKTSPKSSKEPKKLSTKPDETYKQTITNLNNEKREHTISTLHKGTDDEVKLMFPKNMDKKRQAITRGYMAKSYNELPPNLRKGIKEIQVTDKVSIDDAILSKKFGTNFKSTAAADDGKIIFFDNSTTGTHYTKNTLKHESAHILDKGDKLSSSKEWKNAVNNEGYVSDYAKNTSKSLGEKRGLNEDFADSVADYLNGRKTKGFVKNNPEKARLLDKYLNG